MPVKYTVQLDETAARNAAAFAPVPAVDQLAAFSGPGRRSITGHPGDLAVPSPRYRFPTTGSQVYTSQPGSNAPDIIFPSQYYNTIAGQSIAGVKYFSTNELPVPATAYNSIPVIAQRGPRVGGLRSTGWPPATPVWQTLNNTPAGS